MLGQSKQYPKYWLAINPRGVTCVAWEWAQQHSFPCLLLQKKDGCFPRWRSSLKQKDEVRGQETGNRFSLPFLSTWKEPSLLHDAPEKKYEELVLFLPFPFWPFLLSGVEEWNVIEIKVWAPGRQTHSPPFLYHWAGQKMIVLGMKDLRLPWVSQSVRVNQGWHF